MKEVFKNTLEMFSGVLNINSTNKNHHKDTYYS